MSVTKRRDLKKRSIVSLKCDTCGSITVRVPIEEAEIYEAGFRAHSCGTLAQQASHPDVARMLRHMTGGAS